jgi:type I restriction enzyme, S subunit
MRRALRPMWRFFTRGETDKANTKTLWIYDLRNQMEAFGKTRPLTVTDFEDFEKAFGTDPLGKAKRADDHVDNYIFDGDFVLLAEDGGNFDKPESGVAYEVSGKFWINNHAHILKPRGEMPPRFLRYWLNAIDWVPYVGGTTRAKLTQTGMAQVSIPIPSLPEQRRIVAKLDSMTSRTARAREELGRIPKLIQKYRKAILAAAFSGELTQEWRAARGLPPADIVPLESLCATITDGDHQAPPKADRGIPFITISAMNDCYIRLEKATRFVPREYVSSLKPSRLPIAGDVLYSVTGSIGIPALVESNLEFVFQRYIAILKPEPRRVSGRFILRTLGAPQLMEQARSVATGTAQLTIPLSGLRTFKIPFRTLPEQEEIVRRIETAFAWLDRVSTEQANASRLLPKLDQTF